MMPGSSRFALAFIIGLSVLATMRQGAAQVTPQVLTPATPILYAPPAEVAPGAPMVPPPPPPPPPPVPPALPGEPPVAEAEKEEEAEEEEEAVDPKLQPLQAIYDEVVANYFCDSAFMKKMKVAGYLNMSYVYNFHKSKDRVISGRAYDRIHNAFLFNTFQLSAYAESTKESRLGFGFKANAGRNAEVFIPYEEYASDRVDIYELWLSYLITDDVLIKAGKMGTLAGFEVADEKDNYNISRGILWSYLQPVTHTGVRATYTSPDEDYDITLGVHRGWDVFRYDNNDALSYEARLGIKQSEKLNYGITYLVGPENQDDDNKLRHLLDLVVNYTISEKTSLGLNYDLRFDENGAEDGETAMSNGLAGYLKHDINDKLSVAGRLEFIADDDGAHTGQKQNLGDLTLTAQYKFQENLFGRVEFRHDQASEDYFARGSGTGKSQNTVAVSVNYTF